MLGVPARHVYAIRNVTRLYLRNLAHFVHHFLSRLTVPQPRRPLFVPGPAEARVAIEAVRFRAPRVQLHA